MLRAGGWGGLLIHGFAWCVFARVWNREISRYRNREGGREGGRGLFKDDLDRNLSVVCNILTWPCRQDSCPKSGRVRFASGSRHKYSGSGVRTIHKTERRVSDLFDRKRKTEAWHK